LILSSKEKKRAAAIMSGTIKIYQIQFSIRGVFLVIPEGMGCPLDSM
jgi:hypothetical protein